MTIEKESTLRLLREGIGNQVHVLETLGGGSFQEVRAHLPELSESSRIPVLFLITSLAFLEASPYCYHPEFNEIDGWTPADFLSQLRFDRNQLKVSLEVIRGRSVQTEVFLNEKGDLKIRTNGRGQSATRWLSYVQGRSHLQQVSS